MQLFEKWTYLDSATWLIVIVICTPFLHAASAHSAPKKDLVEYVSPNIGGIGQLLTATIPYVQLPHGMARLAPITMPNISDRYLADKISGFPAGPALLMASIGDGGTNPDAYASGFDHDFETSTPYYYAVDLDTWGIKAELTVGQDSAYYRFTFPKTPRGHLMLSLGTDAELQVVSDRTLQGSQEIHVEFTPIVAKASAPREYFYIEFSRPFGQWQTWFDKKLTQEANLTGDKIGFVSDLAFAAGQQVEAHVGISYISVEQAKKNLLRDSRGLSFDQVQQSTRSAWNKALGAVSTTGGTEKQRTIFYTALYRSLGRMTDITEDGRYYSAFDHSVHDSGGHNFYVDDGIWDTYRSLHPLQLLLDPRRQQDMIRSYLRMYEQSGWLPSFPSIAGEQSPMIGHHAAALILDAYAKGYRDFDVEEAYEAIRKNETEATLLPWRRGPLTALDRVYFDKGFFPALSYGEKEFAPEVDHGERRQAVSVTIENSFDDWCLAQLAKAMGKNKDADYFSRLAHNYQNVFNPTIGFMAPRSAEGKWVEHFDPKLGGGQGGREYFTEVNSWIYTFGVQHDVAGLMQLMGGRDQFNAKLDKLFQEQYSEYKFQFLSQFPDATGLVGLYAQGNEPSLHIPYLYDFSGQPWKTQRRVRELMDVWYGDGPLGIPGDDDGGETSSWYVMSAMGFYPVCPGSPVYEIGSPIFAKTVIRIGGAGEFTVIADGVSKQNKYIQSATLNGRPLEKAWFRHADIAQGGTLILKMGDKPNRAWGSSRQDAPPSMSNEEANATK
ncbi:alpha-1,2-mannosidase, putative [Granulicella rosea]|uniref:Alpha-1,2-mannosidase, putative n=1 Tax=Granulicella rosea TaxID=474952 RepID=A0A239EAP2_9BACT|nr:GH92 family glycosyl hydrolase [Granulicella rosea]SNS41569.1 alpha-1,2-mannosidase, putative [Granulicella rosea]